MNVLNEKFTAQQLNQYRPILGVYGKFYGKALVCPACDNVDLKWNERLKNETIRLEKPAKKFITNVVIMTDFTLDIDANEKPVLIINNDPDLTFPLIGNETPQIMDCSAEKINEAIRRNREDGTITFFTNIEAVTKTVINLNNQTIAELEKYAEELIDQAAALKNVNKTELSTLKEYNDSLKQL